MALSMRDIKRRIRSVKNTRQITKAMEMVSAAKLRRSEERAKNARPYADKMHEVIARIARSTSSNAHPMLASRPVKKTGYLVITSDRGLAGGYNANLLRQVIHDIKDRQQKMEDAAIFVIGRRGRDFFKKRGFPIIGEMTGLSDYPTYADIKAISTRAIEMFQNGSYDELYLYYNRFVSAISQVPTGKKLLPLTDLAETSQEGSVRHYEYEPSAEEVLSVLLPRYAESLIFSALLDAKASEQGARMTAMGNASDNASDLIKRLNLDYNRARQAAITQEIAEIVGGANALS